MTPANDYGVDEIQCEDALLDECYRPPEIHILFIFKINIFNYESIRQTFILILKKKALIGSSVAGTKSACVWTRSLEARNS